MLLRCVVIALLSLLTLAVPCTAVLAQDMGFQSPSTYRLRGFLNSFNLGGQAATGTVSFDVEGSVTAGTITFNAFHPTQADTKLLTGGRLGYDGVPLFGEFLTGNSATDMTVQGFAPTDDLFFLTSDDGSSEPNNLGLLVGVRQGGTFSMSDLVSFTWRFKALGAPSPDQCCGVAEWALGSLTLDGSGSVTGDVIEFPDGTAGTIPAVGDFAIDADGNVTGSFVADLAGSCGDSLPVDGYMSPDKTLIAAVLQLRCDGVPTGSALVIFQRDPAPMSFVPTDLTGTYDLVELQAYERLLLDGLFRDGGDVTLSSLRTTFVERLHSVEDSLYSDAKQQGWFTARPDKVRARWALGGVGLTALAIGIAVLLAIFTGLGLIGLSLVVVGLVFLVGAGRMPARTAKGTAMLRRVRGFRQVIETADRYFAQWAEQENVFPKMLPYAIVFGLTEKWAAAFASLAQDPTTTPAMAWYVPHGAASLGAFAESIDGFTVATSGTIASTPAGSGSSGFGGGGFSGGGGGGGGGGSW